MEPCVEVLVADAGEHSLLPQRWRPVLQGWQPSFSGARGGGTAALWCRHLVGPQLLSYRCMGELRGYLVPAKSFSSFCASMPPQPYAFTDRPRCQQYREK